jgi:hypothetical protein
MLILLSRKEASLHRNIPQFIKRVALAALVAAIGETLQRLFLHTGRARAIATLQASGDCPSRMMFVMRPLAFSKTDCFASCAIPLPLHHPKFLMR